jgi:hypothetical protein
MVKRKSKKRKGGNTKTPKNTKQLVIKNTLDNFPKFKVFLKQLSNDKKMIQAIPELNNFIKLDREEVKNELSKIPNSDYEKTLIVLHKNKNMKGGSIVARNEISTKCKKNKEEGHEENDPIMSDPLGDEGVRILKDDSFGDNAYCYNETTICDGERFRDNMRKEPYLQREWSSKFKKLLSCSSGQPEEELVFGPFGYPTNDYGGDVAAVGAGGMGLVVVAIFFWRLFSGDTWMLELSPTKLKQDKNFNKKIIYNFFITHLNIY